VRSCFSHHKYKGDVDMWRKLQFCGKVAPLAA
jgi:hypothetical protein